MVPARTLPVPVLIKEDATDSRNFRVEQLSSDLVVCGGGLSGVCTAIAAARQGVTVTLIQDRPVLGGNGSSEVRLWILGATSHMFNNNRYAREGFIVDEILTENLHRNPEGNPLILDTIILEKVVEENNITLFLNTALVGCEKEGNRMCSVQAFNSQTSTSFKINAFFFVDATGDGALAFLAGAPFRIGAEQKDEFKELFAPDSECGHLLGHSIYFYSKDAGHPVKFVPPSYALKNLEQEIPRYKTFSVKEMGCQLWWIEYGGRLDTVHDTEKIKWELWKVVYGVWDYFKNSGKFPDAENLTLEWVGSIPGKRESRRFIGPSILKQQDIVEQRFHHDAVSHEGWSIDLHPADGVFSEIASCTQWHSKGFYQIPFSTMICSQVENLLYGGRIISATHVAFGSSRVMATCGNNGNALGTAVALCQRLKVRPIDLLAKGNMEILQLELMRRGQFIPGYKLNDPMDLVRSAVFLESQCSSFVLDSLPDNGPSKVLTRSLAQMIPLPSGRLPSFDIIVEAVEVTTLIVQARGSVKPYNYTPEVILGQKLINLQPGEHTISLDFETENPQDQYIFLCLLKNEAIAIHTTLSRISALMTVEHECTQEPPNGIGVDTFEKWTPVRRPMGHNLALTLNPPVNAWGLPNIRNGVSRPTKRTNCWVPVHAEGLRRLVKLGWETPRSIRRVVVGFDTDFDHGPLPL
jgi:FAD dependent oxidoreductase